MNTQARVLYVEDQERDHQALLVAIHEGGLSWDVVLARTLAEARSHLLGGRFEVVVASDRVTDGDAADLREDIGDVPLVLVVTSDGEQSALDALERTADDYVVRDDGTVEASHLLRAIRKSLHRNALHQKERQLRVDLHDSEQQLRAVFENAASGIILTDGQDRLVAVNDRLCQMLGYTREQLIGMSVRDLTCPEDRARSDDLNARIHAGPTTTYQYEKRYFKQDGSLLWVDVSVSAVRDDEGGYLYSVGTVIDISARKEAEAQLRLQAAALAAAPSAISLSTTNPDGTIVWVNEAFTKLTGYAPHEAIGRTHHMLSSGMQDEAFYQQMWQTIKTGELWRGELVNRRKDGTLYHEEMGVTPIVDDAGRVTHYVAIKQDITARKQVEAALAEATRIAEQARAEAVEASQAKDRFLAVLSHELRTPLAPVVTALALLQRDVSLSDRAHAQLALMRRNVDLESRLIDDLLDVTRIARGRIDLERQSVDLRTILERAIEVCRPDMDARHLHFGVDADADHYPVYADARRLEQVFWNLLKNSVKFTPQDGCVGLRCRSDSDDRVVVEVNDSGMGIEAGVVEHMFDAFAKGVDSRSRRFGGLGLGLAICKALVEMHGGTISAHSDGPDRGAMITVTLPLSREAAGRDGPSTSARPAAKPVPSPLHILLVEDHGDTADMMKMALEQDGHSVAAAADVATALALLADGRFDLLLSDLGLPDRSGLDLVRDMRARGLKLPAIALSGYGQERDIEQSLEAGFDAHLVKPVDDRRLEKTIAAVVHKRRHVRQ